MRTEPHRPNIRISYGRQCNWLSRFGQDLAEVALVPATGGLFHIEIDGILVWDRKARGGFPDAKQLKQVLRDQIWPARDLGHVDRLPPQNT